MDHKRENFSTLDICTGRGPIGPLGSIGKGPIGPLELRQKDLVGVGWDRLKDL